MFENEYKWMNEQTTYQKHLMESVPKWNQPLSHYIRQRAVFFLLFSFVCFCLSKWPKYQKYCVVFVAVVVFTEQVLLAYQRYSQYIWKQKRKVCAHERVCAFVLAHVCVCACGMSDKMEKYECESHHLNKKQTIAQRISAITMIKSEICVCFSAVFFVVFHFVADTNTPK